VPQVAFLLSAEGREDQARLEELMQFLRRFEKKWNMDENGRFKPDT
jgi:hypothetical protein